MQAQLWQLAQRTTALPFGRGAFTLATTCTLLTEVLWLPHLSSAVHLSISHVLYLHFMVFYQALAIPKLVLAGRLPAQQNAMVNSLSLSFNIFLSIFLRDRVSIILKLSISVLNFLSIDNLYSVMLAHRNGAFLISHCDRLVGLPLTSYLFI